MQCKTTDSQLVKCNCNTIVIIPMCGNATMIISIMIIMSHDERAVMMKFRASTFLFDISRFSCLLAGLLQCDGRCLFQRFSICSACTMKWMDNCWNMSNIRLESVEDFSQKNQVIVKLTSLKKCPTYSSSARLMVSIHVFWDVGSLWFRTVTVCKHPTMSPTSRFGSLKVSPPQENI